MIDWLIERFVPCMRLGSSKYLCRVQDFVHCCLNWLIIKWLIDWSIDWSLISGILTFFDWFNYFQKKISSLQNCLVWPVFLPIYRFPLIIKSYAGFSYPTLTDQTTFRRSLKFWLQGFFNIFHEGALEFKMSQNTLYLSS